MQVLWKQAPRVLPQCRALLGSSYFLDGTTLLGWGGGAAAGEGGLQDDSMDGRPQGHAHPWVKQPLF